MGYPSQASSSASLDGSIECDVSPAIFVQTAPNQGCWSYVGVLSKVQQLQLQTPGCDSLGTTIHELGHALGMGHEQSRPDRDEYVQIHEANIIAGNFHNFEMNVNVYDDQPYQFDSIMHYDGYAFSSNGQPTITSVDGTHDMTLGQDVGLSQGDADQVAAMYREVVDTCTANSVDSSQKGCMDSDPELCASLSICTSETEAEKCCGCGGGFTLFSHQLAHNAKWTRHAAAAHVLSLRASGQTSAMVRTSLHARRCLKARSRCRAPCQQHLRLHLYHVSAH